MRKIVLAFIALAAATVSGQSISPELKVVTAAAEALGGKDRILAVKTLTIHGYGQLAYQNGGGNITGSPDAPQKWLNINGSIRTIDLEHGRMRLRQKQFQDFVFAYERNMRGVQVDQGLDGDIAFNVNAEGRAARASDAIARARRIEMLNNPIAIVRLALDPATKRTNLRKSGGVQAIDLTMAQGGTVTLALDIETNLPTWMSWIGPDPNLGDVTYRTYFSGYQDEGGVRVPAGYSTVMDFRNVVQQKLYVDRTIVDGRIDDLSAPPNVRAAAAPVPAPPTIEVVPVAKGIWYLKGQGNSTAYEFSDHITLFEAYGSEANAKAIIEKARTLVPGKPVTEVIISHHHFDHSGGLRAAVAEGLTIITHRGNTRIFQEMAARPAKVFPDALGRNPKLIKIRPVDEKLVLKAAVMEVHVLRTINNSHMANGVLAWVPRDRLVSQGDLVDQGWDISFWGNSYPDSVKFWGLKVDKDLAVHGDINTYERALELMRKQAANAKAFCAKVEAVDMPMQGCPATNTSF